MGCHLAGACPFEVLDISPWAEATFQHFLRNPLAQRLPRKFKINFSGCSTDCGQAMFNDVGVVAASRTLDDGTTEVGFRVYVARRARREPASSARARTIHLTRGSAADDRVDPASVRAERQSQEQAAGSHEVARRHARLRRAAGAHLCDPKVPAGVVDMARRHPQRGREARRRSRRCGRRRHADGDRAGHPRCATRDTSIRALGTSERGARGGQGHRVGQRVLTAWRRHVRSVPIAGCHPAGPRPRGAHHQPAELRVPRAHRGTVADPLRTTRVARDGRTRCRAGT